MVYADVSGNVGNQLFQLTFARLLAEELGYSLHVPAESVAQVTALFPEALSLSPRKVVAGDTVLLGSCPTSIKEMADSVAGKSVRVKGYFERSELYLPYREKIRSWYPVKRRDTVHTVVNIRGGDLRKITMSERHYYEAAIASVGPGAVVVTDDPRWDWIITLRLPIKHWDAATDFACAASASRLVIGRSTFSWWAAFLGHASQVIQPEPLSGWRSKGRFPGYYLGVPDWAKIEMYSPRNDLP